MRSHEPSLRCGCSRTSRGQRDESPSPGSLPLSLRASPPTATAWSLRVLPPVESSGLPLLSPAAGHRRPAQVMTGPSRINKCQLPCSALEASGDIIPGGVVPRASNLAIKTGILRPPGSRRRPYHMLATVAYEDAVVLLRESNIALHQVRWRSPPKSSVAINRL